MCAKEKSSMPYEIFGKEMNEFCLIFNYNSMGNFIVNSKIREKIRVE